MWQHPLLIFPHFTQRSSHSTEIDKLSASLQSLSFSSAFWALLFLWTQKNVHCFFIYLLDHKGLRAVSRHLQCHTSPPVFSAPLLPSCYGVVNLSRPTKVPERKGDSQNITYQRKRGRKDLPALFLLSILVPEFIPRDKST